MPFYRALAKNPKSSYPFEHPISPAMRERTAEGLLRLRAQFALEDVPRRTLDKSLLLATWNLREFDVGSKFDRRLPESYYYIAEIIDHFDLVAVQEVREDLRPLDRVIKILGDWWKYIVTDVTYGTGGNGERMAFIYDSRKIDFGGLAGEIVLPGEVVTRHQGSRNGKPGKNGKVPANGPLQFARTPYLCGFRAHWTRFNLCTVHLYWGDSKPNNPRRLREIEKLTALLAKYVAPPPPKQPGLPKGDENLILLGDFNIFSREDETMQAMLRNGFTVPEELAKNAGTNLKQDRFYDQIAFRVRPDRFATTHRAGVFNFQRSLFRPEDESVYAAEMGAKCGGKYKSKADAAARSSYYREWSTYQMSDHLLLWVELRIDFSGEYLEEAAGLKLEPPVRKAVAGNGAVRTKKPKRKRKVAVSKEK